MDFPKRLAALRIRHNMTQQELADRVGVSRATLGMYELGRRDPDTETLLRIAQIFGVSVDYLLKGYDEQSKLSAEIELEDILKQNTVFFNGEPLDEEAKEGILKFLKLVIETSEKRRKE